MNSKQSDIESNLSLLKVDREDEVNYAFLKTVQNKYMCTDFMREFEEYLYQKMLKRFNENCKNFKFDDFCLPIKTYHYQEINGSILRDLVCQNDVPPFIVKGFAQDSNAVRKWNLEYFAKHYADAEVAYAIMYRDKARKDGLYGKLNEVIRLMKQAKDETVYIHNTSQIFKDFRDLLNDIQYSTLQEFYKPIAVNAIVQLFMGVRKSVTDLHCANEFNSFLMIQGKKKWTFASYEYSYALRGNLNVNAFNAITEIDDYTRDFEYFEKKYPMYNRIPKLVGEIEPGDMLVFSPWWWHGVENTTDTTIGVATRWTAKKRDLFPRGNIIYQNIQKSNELFKKFSKEFLSAVVKGELIGDKVQLREYFGKTGVITDSEE